MKATGREYKETNWFVQVRDKDTVYWIDLKDLTQFQFLALRMTLYSIILPTYNEKENLPIITWIIDEVMNKRWVVRY